MFTTNLDAFTPLQVIEVEKACPMCLTNVNKSDIQEIVDPMLEDPTSCQTQSGNGE